jgi:hypothetical protein
MDMALWLVCIAAEAVVVVLTFRQRLFRTLPMFSVWATWGLCSDLVSLLITRNLPSYDVYVRVYIIEFPLDLLLQFIVLVELTWSVFRPYRSLLPRWTIFAFAGVIAAVGAVVWPFANIPGFSTLPSQWHFIVRLQQSCSILRVLYFLLLAGSSQLLSIGWRNRELQVATGLGFYSIFSLAAAVVHKQYANPAQYHLVEEIVVVSYIFSLVYWSISFAQKEAVRQAFSPKMQSILLTLAGETRAARIALTEPPGMEGPSRRKP